MLQKMRQKQSDREKERHPAKVFFFKEGFTLGTDINEDREPGPTESRSQILCHQLFPRVFLALISFSSILQH